MTDFRGLYSCLVIVFLIIMNQNIHSQTNDSIDSSQIFNSIEGATSLINFDDLTFNYSSVNNVDVDLERKTRFDQIVFANEYSTSKYEGSLEIKTVSIEGTNYQITGRTGIEKKDNKHLVYNGDTIFDCTLMKIHENYSIHDSKDTLAKYDCTYYSFLKDGVLILELFKRQRYWGEKTRPLLSQNFQGTSVNLIGQAQTLNVNLSPNPATSVFNTSFNLSVGGNVSIRLLNNAALIDIIVHDSFLANGPHSIQSSIQGLPTGTYTIIVSFNNVSVFKYLVIH